MGMDGSKIKQLAVKIISSKGADIGSGTLFVPNSNGVYAYIFTAAHLLFKGKIKEKNLKFKMIAISILHTRLNRKIKLCFSI